MDSRNVAVSVVGKDGTEQCFTFEALPIDGEGNVDYSSSSLEFVNNDILSDCLLGEGFQEVRIVWGDMKWSMQGSALSPASQHIGRRVRLAVMELERYDGDDASEEDVTISSLLIDTSPNGDGIDLERPDKMPSGISLGNILYAHAGKRHKASCLPFGRVKGEDGQIFDRVDAWLQHVQRLI